MTRKYVHPPSMAARKLAMRPASSNNLLMLPAIATGDELVDLWRDTKSESACGQKYVGLLLAATTVSGVELLAIMRSGTPEAADLRAAREHATNIRGAFEKILELMAEGESRIADAIHDPGAPPQFPKVHQ